MPGLAPGNRVALARSAGRRGIAEFTCPTPEKCPVIVHMRATRDVEVVVRQAPSGRPVVGARVRVTASRRTGERSMMGWSFQLREDPSPTDEQGRTVIRDFGIEPGTRAVARVCGLDPANTVGGRESRFSARLNGHDEVVIEIPDGARVGFKVVATEGPIPKKGTVLHLSLHPSYGSTGYFPSTASMAGDRVVVDGLTPGVRGMLARAPDGSLAILELDDDGLKTGRGLDTSFHRPRTANVRVLRSDGSPAMGLLVELESGAPFEPAASAPLDADGRAELDNLHAKPYRLSARIAGRPEWEAWFLGTVDLKTGDAQLEVTLEPEIDVLLRVRVDGVARLPGSLAIGVRGGRRSGEAKEDPETGSVRFSVQPFGTDPLRVAITADGFPYTTLPIPKDTNPAVVNVDLVSGATATVAIVPPNDDRYELQLEQWRDKSDSWIPVRHSLRQRGAATIRLTDLVPGRYRIADALSGLCSPEAELRAGAEHQFAVNLATTGWVEGRVVVPDGQDVRGALIHATGEGLSTAGRFGKRAIGTTPDGTFKARVPGDRPVTLAVSHPLLLPDPRHGTITVRSPGSAQLRLVQGATTTFRLLESPDFESGMHRALLYADAPEGAPAHTREISYDDKTGRIGGYPPGRWTLWFDLPPDAPVVLRNVDLGPGATDLGQLAIKIGASIRVNVRRRTGDRTRIWASVRRLGAPGYERSASGTDDTIVVSGLGPGRFLVTVGSRKQEVTSDGRATISLDFDLSR